MLDPLPTAMLVAIAALALVVAGAVGVALYVAATFALMRAHAPSRGWGPWWRALLRESWFILLTQPLLPLFYLFGQRLDRVWLVGLGSRLAGAPQTTPPVVFVHGYMHNRVGFLGLARALARRGLGPIYAINYPWFARIEENAARLGAFIDRVREETGAPVVDLVCHSMGGLIAIELLKARAAQGEAPVRRCVTIASPHGGIRWRGPLLGEGGASLRRGSNVLTTLGAQRLDVPFLSIFSAHDNIVFPKETSSLAARGGRDVEIDNLAHLSILFSPEVAAHVADFLLERGA